MSRFVKYFIIDSGIFVIELYTFSIILTMITAGVASICLTIIGENPFLVEKVDE
jgi:hypothetical protein